MKKRGLCPRFTVVRGAVLSESGSRAEGAKTAGGPGAVATFEAGVATLAQEPEFASVEFVESRARRNGSTHELTLIVDREGGVDITTCERMSSRLNALLAECSEHYTLNVESAGLERPLTKAQDFERFSGRNVVVKTSAPVAHEYTHTGTLRGLRDNHIILQQRNGESAIPLAVVKTAHLAFDPRADLRRAKQERRETHGH